MKKHHVILASLLVMAFTLGACASDTPTPEPVTLPEVEEEEPAPEPRVDQRQTEIIVFPVSGAEASTAPEYYLTQSNETKNKAKTTLKEERKWLS